MEKFFKVVVTTQEDLKTFYVDHVYDVENLIDALFVYEALSVTPLPISQVTKDNANSLIHDKK